jgi:Uma2 family endonuclease
LRSFLRKEKRAEEIMGSGGIQSVLIALLVGFLYSKLDRKKFILATNEVGFRISNQTFFNLDIAIFDREKLKEIPSGYITTPPEVVIEVDTKADLSKFSSPTEYFHLKTEKLLKAGVKKVIWIFTKEKKVWIAEKEKPWIIGDWDLEIEIMKGITLKLKELF